MHTASGGCGPPLTATASNRVSGRDGSWTRGYGYPWVSYPVDMDTGRKTHPWVLSGRIRNTSGRVWVKYFTHGYPVDTRNINIPL
jgi:hypothetical protein